MATINPNWRDKSPKWAFDLEALVEDGELRPDKWSEGLLELVEDE